jgi:ATP-binding cassette subfamily B protein
MGVPGALLRLRRVGRPPRRRLARRIAGELRPHWRGIAAVAMLNLLAAPLTLLAPVPLKIAVDNVIGGRPLSAPLAALLPSGLAGNTYALLAVACLLLVLVVLLTGLQDAGTDVVSTLVGWRVTLGFRSRLFHHLQELSIAFHDARGVADSIYRVQYDALSLQNLVITAGLPLLSAALTLASMIYVIARIDAELAAVALTVCPVLLLLSMGYNRRMRRRYRAVKELESNALKVVQEVLAAVRVVKAFGRERAEIERFRGRTSQGVRARVRLTAAEGVFALLVSLTTALGTAAILFLGVGKVKSGALTLGSLLVVVTYLTQLYRPLTSATKKVADVQTSLAGAERAFEVLDERRDVEERRHARRLRRARGELEFRQVSFSYDGEHEVLSRVSFHAAAGLRVAISGRTGAGKTTLVSLLMRFYDPTSGQVLLDGIDLREFRLADLRSQFAIVLQDPVLFSTTIAENIAYGRPGADLQAIIEAGRAANAHSFISALPEGYETLVGERGMRLSGGERQRIALARAYLKDVPVLVLDEPTSSVDVRTEAEIMEAMERVAQGRTTIIIAHRASTLRRCQLRVRLEHGRVVGRPRPKNGLPTPVSLAGWNPKLDLQVAQVALQGSSTDGETGGQEGRHRSGRWRGRSRGTTG